MLAAIAGICSELKIDGHRGEITIARASRALAALEGRKKVSESDVRRVAVMALRHRLRRDSLEEVGSLQRIENAMNKVFGSGTGVRGAKDDGDGDDSPSNGRYADNPRGGRSESPTPGTKSFPSPNGAGKGPKPDPPKPDGELSSISEVVASPLEKRAAKVNANLDLKLSTGSQSMRKDGRGSRAKKTVYSRVQGRYAKAVSSRRSSARIALDATLRAIAVGRCSFSSNAVVPAGALRFKLFKRKQGRLFIFAIDLSGSMALNRINHARDAIVGLLRQSYIYRDSVAIIGFRETRAELMLPPARSIIRARRVLESLPMGGGTPLSAGLACALDLAKRAGPTAGARVLLIFTDGGANVPLGTPTVRGRTERRRLIETEVKVIGNELRKAGVDLVMLDTSNSLTSHHDARNLAETLGAKYVDLQPSAAKRSRQANLIGKPRG